MMDHLSEKFTLNSRPDLVVKIFPFFFRLVWLKKDIAEDRNEIRNRLNEHEINGMRWEVGEPLIMNL